MLRIGARAGLDVVDDASCSSVCLRAERAMERGADVGFGVQMLERIVRICEFAVALDAIAMIVCFVKNPILFVVELVIATTAFSMIGAFTVLPKCDLP